MSDQRKLTISVAAGVLVAFVIVVVGVISLDRDESAPAPAAGESAGEVADETADEEAAPGGEESAGGGAQGAGDEQAIETFVSNCGQCHTLSVAGTSGEVGPNLDDNAYDEQRVLSAIENGGRGSGQMPPNLIEGEQAQQVAELIAGDEPGS